MNSHSIKKIIKGILVAKVAAACVILAYLNQDIYFGERPLNAESNPSPQKAEQPGADIKEKAAGEKVVDPKRKSFLDGLLNLPEITDSPSKNEEIGRYLTLAERKKQQVEERLDLLEGREVQLKRIEAVIDEKLARLEDERLFFSQTIQKEKEIQADRLERLVDLYAKMEPKKAGPVFETMDRDLVIALFNKMEKKVVTRILEVVSAPRSVELTEYFGRIRSGKEYDLLKEMNASLRTAFDECKGMNSLDPTKAPSGEGGDGPRNAPERQ